MAIPLHHVVELDPGQSPMGDYMAKHVTDTGKFENLISVLATSENPSIISPDEARIPLQHSQLVDFVRQFSIPTSKHQLSRNDRVVLLLPPGPETALASIAVATYYTLAPLNYNCTQAELLEDAGRLRAKCIITIPAAHERFNLTEVIQSLNCDIVYLQPYNAQPAGIFSLQLSQGTPQSQERHPQSQESLPTPNGWYDRALVLQTSGTSGKKKVVPYTLRSLVVGACCVIKSWDLRSSDVNLNMMPLFHVGGIIRNLFAPILAGGSTIACPSFDAPSFLPIVRRHSATFYYAAPTMHLAILSACHDLGEGLDNAFIQTKIRMIGSAAGGLPPSLAQRLHTHFGAIIFASYGLTECLPAAAPPLDAAMSKPASSGVAAGPEITIRHPSNLEQELAIGQSGAICMRGLPTFEGYEIEANLPLDTSAFTSEGWFDSGDCGYFDSEGFLYITGRSKEILNVSGEVISPFEIEEAINQACVGAVSTSLAFVVEHSVTQEGVGVVLVPTPNQPRLSLSQLQERLKDHLVPSKWPFVIVYMDALPKNNAGKALRINLNKRLDLPIFSNDTPKSVRHFEASAPNPNDPISTPIPSRLVQIDSAHITSTISGIFGVKECGIVHSTDGSITGFIRASSASVKEHIISQVRSSLDGYAIPQPLHIVSQPLRWLSNGVLDGEAMREIVDEEEMATLSSTALRIRQIMSDLLNIDTSAIQGDSDFFLIGGTSLLLGRLCFNIKKTTGVALPVATVFMDSTVNGIAHSIDSQSDTSSIVTKVARRQASDDTITNYLEKKPYSHYANITPRRRSQWHPWVLLVQAIPFVILVPLKAAFRWSMLLTCLSVCLKWVGINYWYRMLSLIGSMFVAEILTHIAAPILSIFVKWIVIGKYKSGIHPTWSNYYLRYWVVDQCIKCAGKGVFSLHTSLEIFYYRLMGARIGKDVQISSSTILGEFDLLQLEDGCKLDRCVVRGFAVGRNATFSLGKIVIGRNSVINSYTSIAPGSKIEAGEVYGPHSSSHESPSPPHHAAFSAHNIPEVNLWLKVLIGWPICILVNFLALLPWLAVIWLMMREAIDLLQSHDGATRLHEVIRWFASPERIKWHITSRIIRHAVTPVFRLALGVATKRALGLNKPQSFGEQTSQLVLLRRYVNSVLLSQWVIQRSFDVIGTHYESVSIIYRAMGAKIGKRIFWAGKAFICPDPELLEVGDDVTFGSRSELRTCDQHGLGRIEIRAAAMIADRNVLLPNTIVGRHAILGSGTLGQRDTQYADHSVWMGVDSDTHSTTCLNKGREADVNSETITPFGRAFYQRKANFFVLPYIAIFFINLVIIATSAAYWTMPGVLSSRVIQAIGHDHPFIFAQWYSFGVFYALIAACFIVILNSQAIICIIYSILHNRIVIGKRKEGACAWDESSYCQRWKINLMLARPLNRGFSSRGVLGPLTGTAIIAWYYRMLGTEMGKDCVIYPGGKLGLLTEPDLVKLGDQVSIDAASVVAHINSRGKFSLNRLVIGNGCALRSSSRLLSGASMEDDSMLLEHTLLASGEVAEEGIVYSAWPGRPHQDRDGGSDDDSIEVINVEASEEKKKDEISEKC